MCKYIVCPSLVDADALFFEVSYLWKFFNWSCVFSNNAKAYFLSPISSELI